MTQTYSITFLPSETTVAVPEGTTLLEAQIRAGMQPDAPCGGQGKCGKCLVQILSGPVTGTVKACTTPVTGDMTVDTRAAAKEHKLLATGSSREIPIHPHFTLLPVTLPPIALGENTTDWQRLKRVLAKSLPEAAILEPDLTLISGLHAFYQENPTGWAVLGSHKILSLTHEKPACYLTAFDIGTTSIVGYLLDGTSGATLASASLLNPQSQYGADVIMRSNYALEHSVEPLSSCVRQALMEIIHRLCRQASIQKEQIYQVSIAGNTCMSHLFLGISPDSLVHAPYHPAISDPLVEDAASLGLQIHPRGQVLILPNIAGFVGADTVGCLLSTDFDRRKKLTLLIDIGTNGEMVLGRAGKSVCCSTAAGPAFEGAKITCGMRGASGAIDHAHFEGETLVCSVIGDAAPSGICGSGLMDLLAELLFYGFVDDSGRLLSAEELESPTALANHWRIQEMDGMPIFMITEDGDVSPVYLTQKDIREVQLAKAAIAAGINLMADHLDVPLDSIEEVLIAGAFGNYMDPKSACRIGLIPYELRDRITSIGNAAGEGAKMALLSREEWLHAAQMAAQTEFLELATSPQFQDCFVDELEFTICETWKQ